MATPTSKHVTRVTMRAKPVKQTLSGHCGKPRELIVSIIGDTFFLRPKGLRTGVYADIFDVYYAAQRAEQRSLWAQRQNARRRAKRA